MKTECTAKVLELYPGSGFEITEFTCLKQWIDARSSPSALTTDPCTDECLEELEQHGFCSHMQAQMVAKLRKTYDIQATKLHIHNPRATITASPEQVEQTAHNIIRMPPELSSIIADYHQLEPIMLATIHYHDNLSTGEVAAHLVTYNLNTDDLAADSSYYYRYLIPYCCTLHKFKRPVQWLAKSPMNSDEVSKRRDEVISSWGCPGVETCGGCQASLHLFDFAPEDTALVHRFFPQLALQPTEPLDGNPQTERLQRPLKLHCGNTQCGRLYSNPLSFL